jgi:CBS domain-containing protein
MARAQDIMTTDPACVTPDTLLADAARMMKDQNVGLLPVVEGEGSDRLVGVVTDRDITIRHVAEGHGPGCPVREAMTTNVTTARADDDVDRVMDLMGREQVRRIPIVDERGALVGIVSQADIALETDEGDAGETVQKISKPFGSHAS